MIRLVKRRRAITGFVRRLPLELRRRFGEKRTYPIRELDRAVERAGWRDGVVFIGVRCSTRFGR